MNYIIITIITVLLIILATVLLLKVHVEYTYEISNFAIRTKLNIILLKKVIYNKEKNFEFSRIIDIYINDKKKKEQKFKINFAVLKENVNNIIKNIAKEKVKLEIDIGIINPIMQAYSMAILSGIISKYLCTNIKLKNAHNIQYIIKPNYTNTYIQIHVNILVNLIMIIKIYFMVKKIKGGYKNGITSN